MRGLLLLFLYCAWATTTNAVAPEITSLWYFYSTLCPFDNAAQRLARRQPAYPNLLQGGGERGRGRSFVGTSSAATSNGCLQALDVHGGHHAAVTGRGAHGWALKAAQAGISSFGGAPVLLPLFASCLASNAPVVADVGLVAAAATMVGMQEAKNYWGGNVACRLFTLARFSQGQATNQVL